MNSFYFFFLALIQMLSVAVNYTTFGFRDFTKFQNVLISFNTIDLIRDYTFLLFILILLLMLIGWEKHIADSKGGIRIFKEIKTILKDMGFFRFKPRRKQFRIFMIFLLIFFSMYIFFPSRITSYENLLKVIVFWIPITLEEELVFRYGVFKHLREKKVNTVLIYLVSALIFGAGHFYKDGISSPPVSVIIAMVYGLFYQFAYESSGWSIYVSWFLHIFGNVLAPYFL